VTVYGEVADAPKSIVPVMAPLDGSMASPEGRPVAAQEIASPSGSLPAMPSTARSPSAPDCGPGSTTIGARLVSVTTHAKVPSTHRAGDPESVSRTVTAYGDAGDASKVMVPEMIPVPGAAGFMSTLAALYWIRRG